MVGREQPHSLKQSLSWWLPCVAGLGALLGVVSFGNALAGITLAMLLVPITLLASLALTITITVQMTRHWSRAKRLIALLLAFLGALAVPVLLIVLGWSAAAEAAYHGWLAWHRPAFERIVALMEAGKLQPRRVGFWETYEGVDFIAGRGQPLRIAFPVPGGVRGNVTLIVYDPTGRVLEASGWDDEGFLRTPRDIRRLFFHNLVKCEPYEAPFYECVTAWEGDNRVRPGR